jgi:hypothetical protein
MNSAPSWGAEIADETRNKTHLASHLRRMQARLVVVGIKKAASSGGHWINGKTV